MGNIPASFIIVNQNEETACGFRNKNYYRLKQAVNWLKGYYNG